MFVTSKDDDSRQAADKAAPALISKDVCQKGTTLADDGSVGGHGCRHGVVPSDTNAKDDAEYCEPDQGTSWREITLAMGNTLWTAIYDTNGPRHAYQLGMRCTESWRR